MVWNGNTWMGPDGANKTTFAAQEANGTSIDTATGQAYAAISDQARQHDILGSVYSEAPKQINAHDPGGILKTYEATINAAPQTWQNSLGPRTGRTRESK